MYYGRTNQISSVLHEFSKQLYFINGAVWCVAKEYYSNFEDLSLLVVTIWLMQGIRERTEAF